ncbi:unnamed protein product [Lymnaea stagnalis]|uniref:Uncharacterized protein n=1 Tax=Lymnaea stagnalis TaxID=6523 RepID=A0AAV2H2W4_LYMST
MSKPAPVTAGVNAENHTVSFKIANDFLTRKPSFTFAIKTVNETQKQAEFQITVEDKVVASHVSAVFPSGTITVRHKKLENNFYVVKLEHPKGLTILCFTHLQFCSRIQIQAVFWVYYHSYRFN